MDNSGKKLTVIITLIVLLGVLLFAIRKPLVSFIAQKVLHDLPPAIVADSANSSTAGNVSLNVSPLSFKKLIKTSGLLSNDVAETSATLTKEGVIDLTNQARLKNGNLPALTENATLDTSAQAKLKDMFDKQYFEHVSLTNVGPGDVVQAAGYDYIMVGENLALGGFTSNADLVDAWMNSPGHRANILNTKYKEIGVAVGTGMYKGRKVWIGVQHFGVPLSTCLQVDKNLSNTIENEQQSLAVMQAELEKQRTDLDATSKYDSEYSNKVTAYNQAVESYNALLTKIKAEIETYNAGVANFNTCISVYN